MAKKKTQPAKKAVKKKFAAIKAKAVKKPAKKAKSVKKAKNLKIAKPKQAKEIVKIEPEKPFVKPVSKLPDRPFLKPVEIVEPKLVKRRVKKGKISPAGKKFLELAKEFLDAKKDAYFMSDENIAEIMRNSEQAVLGAVTSNQVVEFLIEEFPLAEGSYGEDNFNRRIFTDLAAVAAEKQGVSEKTSNKLMESLIKALEFESKIPCRDDMEYDAKHDQMARQVRNLKTLKKDDEVELLLKKYMFLKFFWDQEKIESH
ncbi:MAG: hypothetical protein Q7K42_02065 [Candidatus Diapherotrites archaeon]|nr:hypothetical protein [Candidatus Diapherotrites archaeon]